MEPREVIAAPFTLWSAVVGTAFPDVDEEPGVGWTKIGTSGDKNYDEEGVTVAHDQEIVKWRGLGSLGPVKAFRVSEDQMVRLKLVDLSLDQFRHAMNYNAVTVTAASLGVAGTKKIGLSRGHTVERRSLLIRGNVSPDAASDDAGLVMQYEVPIAILESSLEVTHQKGTPAALALEWSTLEDPNAASDDERFGRLFTQTAAALT